MGSRLFPGYRQVACVGTEGGAAWLFRGHEGKEELEEVGRRRLGAGVGGVKFEWGQGPGSDCVWEEYLFQETRGPRPRWEL